MVLSDGLVSRPQLQKGAVSIQLHRTERGARFFLGSFGVNSFVHSATVETADLCGIHPGHTVGDSEATTVTLST